MFRILTFCFFLVGARYANAQYDVSAFFDMVNKDSVQMGIPVGEFFPLDTFKTITNEEIIFNDKNYTLTIINFWFKQCKGCIQEKRFLKRLTEHYWGYEKIRFISITPTNLGGIEKSIEKHGSTNYEIVSMGSFIAVEELFHFRSYPRHVILNKDAQVLAQYSIPIANHEFLKEYITRIEGFLEEESVK
jgi:peroxiredoxin